MVENVQILIKVFNTGVLLCAIILWMKELYLLQVNLYFINLHPMSLGLILV